MGAWMSLRPPQPHGRGHWLWLAAFVIVGAITGWATYSKMLEDDATQSQLIDSQKELAKAQQHLQASVDEMSAEIIPLSLGNWQYQPPPSIQIVPPRPAFSIVGGNIGDFHIIKNDITEGCTFISMNGVRVKKFDISGNKCRPRH